MLLTYVFVPDMAGVDLAVEDKQFVRYLNENGWNGNVGVDLSSSPVKDENGVRAGNEVL